MADKDGAAEEVAQEEAVVEEPQSMDEVIEQEAEAELDAERENDGQPTEPESEVSDDDTDAEAEGEESTEADSAEEEPEEEVEDEPEEESEPIDTSSFGEVGLEAVPDDYKPQNWKSFMNDIVEVVRGEVNKEARSQYEQQSAFQAEVAKVDEGWQAEITELQKAGDLPKDSKELEAATKEVFEYMAENNQKYADNPNKQIWSFETAYKLKNANTVTDERKAEIATRRKARATAASAAGNSEGGSGIPRANKGESMDDIIARELGL